MELEGRQVHEFEETRFRERPAVVYLVSGTVHGVRAMYRNVVFANQGYLFQVLAWALEFQADRRTLERFSEAFHVLPGKVEGRSSARAVADVRGVGWRVQDGEFASAVYGLAVEPKGNWRLIVGSELQQVNADAEVGLAHSAPEVFFMVIPERIAGVDPKAFVESILEPGNDEFAVVPKGDPYTVEIAGREVRMHRTVNEGSPSFEFHKGVFLVGDICYQVTAWHMASLEHVAVKALIPRTASGLASVSAAASSGPSSSTSPGGRRPASGGSRPARRLAWGIPTRC